MSGLTLKLGGGATRKLGLADYLDHFSNFLSDTKKSRKAKEYLLMLNKTEINASPYANAIMELASKHLGEARALELLS